MENKKLEPTLKESQEKSSKFAIESLDILTTLGTGSFSRVRLVKSKETSTGKPFALKIFKKHCMMKLNKVENIRSERELLEQLHHASIPALIGTSQDSRYIYLLMEYVCGGELLSRMKKLCVLPVEDAKFYAASLILTLEYLHERNIAYRDLKPENILIDKSGYVKLVDFGFAKQGTARLYTLCGTIEYLAPEQVLQKGHGKEVDWWALGVLIFEMLVGQTPFYDHSPINIYQKIIMGRYHIPQEMDSCAGDLIRRLLEAEVDKRIGGKEINQTLRTHPWFANLDFAQIESRALQAPWIPELLSEDDTSYFETYPDSQELSPVPSLGQRDPFEGF